jgi:hypothetical protein
LFTGAWRSSNAQYEPSFVINRLGVRLLEPAPGDCGWEIFSLDYSLDVPLNAIVHADSLAQYRIAFHMLWRLKRVEWSLAKAWKESVSFAHMYELGHHRYGIIYIIVAIAQAVVVVVVFIIIVVVNQLCCSC